MCFFREWFVFSTEKNLQLYWHFIIYFNSEMKIHLEKRSEQTTNLMEKYRESPINIVSLNIFLNRTKYCGFPDLVRSFKILQRKPNGNFSKSRGKNVIWERKKTLELVETLQNLVKIPMNLFENQNMNHHLMKLRLYHG